MHRTLQYAILFIVMVILQIFLFSRIGISVRLVVRAVGAVHETSGG